MKLINTFFYIALKNSERRENLSPIYQNTLCNTAAFSGSNIVEWKCSSLIKKTDLFDINNKTKGTSAGFTAKLLENENTSLYFFKEANQAAVSHLKQHETTYPPNVFIQEQRFALLKQIGFVVPEQTKLLFDQNNVYIGTKLVDKFETISQYSAREKETLYNNRASLLKKLRHANFASDNHYFLTMGKSTYPISKTFFKEQQNAIINQYSELVDASIFSPDDRARILVSSSLIGDISPTDNVANIGFSNGKLAILDADYIEPYIDTAKRIVHLGFYLSYDVIDKAILLYDRLLDSNTKLPTPYNSLETKSRLVFYKNLLHSLSNNFNSKEKTLDYHLPQKQLSSELEKTLLNSLYQAGNLGWHFGEKIEIEYQIKK